MGSKPRDSFSRGRRTRPTEAWREQVAGLQIDKFRWKFEETDEAIYEVTAMPPSQTVGVSTGRSGQI
jgi:hypothetical protein